MMTRRFVVAVSLATALFAATASHASPVPQKSAPAKVDINSASQADLERLPGVGPAIAKKIIAGRPYAEVGDLSKAGVSKKTIQKITPLVTASAAPAAPIRAAKPAALPPAAKPAAQPPTARPAAPAAAATAAQVPPVKGMVWVNLQTKVYHREGDKWYGKTKHGKFMTEEDAIKAGYHAAKEGGARK